MSKEIAKAPWDSDWWYSIIRDLHNQPGLECGEDDCFGYPGWQGDNTANADLIAAAPDLLNGCKALLGLVRLLAANPNTPPALLRILTEHHRIEEAEKAVAKACGTNGQRENSGKRASENG